MRWTLSRVASVAGGVAFGDRGDAFDRIGTNPEAVAPGSLYVAIRTERWDGHSEAARALAAGARAVVVDDAGLAAHPSLGHSGVVVPDTLRALGQLAAHARRAAAVTTIAITGSDGKTTTKEMTAAVLGQRGEVCRTPGNANNLLGVPLTLVNELGNHWALVCELGMNRPGEIARLTEICAPQVGVICNVGPVHLEGLGTVEAVARAKVELIDGLDRSAVVVLNADDRLLMETARSRLDGRRLLTFSARAGAEVQLLHSAAGPGGQQVVLGISGREVSVSLRFDGAHNALNAAAAAAVGCALDLTVEEIATGLASAAPVAGRFVVQRGVEIPSMALRLNIIDDTYKADPPSMGAAFRGLATLAGGQRRVAVLGDMAELGGSAESLHADIGEAAAAAGIALVVSVGRYADVTTAAARQRGATGVACADQDAAVDALSTVLRDGDWVLFKGSRCMHMEKLLQRVRGDVVGGAR